MKPHKASIPFTGELSQAEFFKFQHLARPYWGKTWFAIVGLTGLMFAQTDKPWRELLQNPAEIVPQFILFAIAVAAILGTSHWVLIKAWKRWTTLHGTIRGQVHADGIHWQSQTGTMDLPWSQIKKSSHDDSMVVLLYSNRSGLIFPKSFFNEANWQRFIEILKREGVIK